MSSTHQLKDRNQKSDIPLSTFAFLFLEFVHYHTHHSGANLDNLEGRLHQAGMPLGKRLLELAAFRQKAKVRKETGAVAALQFIHTTLWKQLFNRTASGLIKPSEKSINTDENAEIVNCQLYLIESEPITNLFVSVPKSYGDVNCAAFLAGMINGAMVEMGIPCQVSAGWDEDHVQSVFVVNVPSTYYKAKK